MRHLFPCGPGTRQLVDGLDVLLPPLTGSLGPAPRDEDINKEEKGARLPCYLYTY